MGCLINSRLSADRRAVDAPLSFTARKRIVACSLLRSSLGIGRVQPLLTPCSVAADFFRRRGIPSLYTRMSGVAEVSVSEIWTGATGRRNGAIARMGVSHLTFIDQSRIWRAVLASLGALWALAILPLPATEFGVPSWSWVFRYRVYFWAREAVHDPYIVFGALAALSFVAIGLALLPDLRRAGWGGEIMVWLVIAGAPVTALSYLNTPKDAPMHFLWGAEAFVLIAVGLAGIFAAVTAGSRWSLWVRIMLGLTLPVLVAGLLATGYWPHGPLVGLGVEATAIILAAPRAAALAETSGSGASPGVVKASPAG